MHNFSSLAPHERDRPSQSIGMLDATETLK